MGCKERRKKNTYRCNCQEKQETSVCVDETSAPKASLCFKCSCGGGVLVGTGDTLCPSMDSLGVLA